MRKIRIIALLMVLIGGMTACHRDDEGQREGMRTVLVYIAGDNTLRAFAEEDLKEMVEGMQEVDVDDCHLLVYLDDGSTPRLLRLKKADGKNETQEVVATYEGRNSVEVENMKEVMHTAFSLYPSKSYGLVLWSHGEGWLPKSQGVTRWWGQDGRNYMDISELSEVLRDMPHLEFLFFDACFMQSVEVAYELKSFTHYLIGSPTEIPAPGAPYQKVVPALFAMTTPALEIGKAYFEYYADEELYTGYLSPSWSLGKPWTAGVSISVINTSMLEQLAHRTHEILPKYVEYERPMDMTGLFCYDCRKSKRYYHDFDGWMRSLMCTPDEYAAWKAAYDATVMYWQTTSRNYSNEGGSFSMDGATGMSSYIFREPYDGSINSFYRRMIQWYSAAGWSETGW